MHILLHMWIGFISYLFICYPHIQCPYYYFYIYKDNIII